MPYYDFCAQYRKITKVFGHSIFFTSRGGVCPSSLTTRHLVTGAVRPKKKTKGSSRPLFSRAELLYCTTLLLLPELYLSGAAFLSGWLRRCCRSLARSVSSSPATINRLCACVQPKARSLETTTLSQEARGACYVVVLTSDRIAVASQLANDSRAILQPHPTPHPSLIMAPPNNRSRSVVDYANETELRKALLALEPDDDDDDDDISNDGCNASAAAGNNNGSSIIPDESICSRASTPATEDADDGAHHHRPQHHHTNSNLDWVLTAAEGFAYDPETTEVQSMSEELKRLQVLKSYAILDAEREPAFERISSIACRVFNVPIALTSLVDLGRQWYAAATYIFCARLLNA